MKLTEEDRAKFNEFETEDLLYIIDNLDAMRGELADDGIRPPEIRDNLLKLHQHAFDTIRLGGQFPENIHELVDDITTSIDNIIENAEKMQELLYDFEERLPEPKCDW